MTVAELIAKLQDMPQDHVALCYDDRYGWIDPAPVLETLYRIRMTDGEDLYLYGPREDGNKTQAVVL